jgi:hypothetical protein
VVVVEVDGLLHQPQAERFEAEIEIGLGAIHGRGHMMQADDLDKPSVLRKTVRPHTTGSPRSLQFRAARNLYRRPATCKPSLGRIWPRIPLSAARQPLCTRGVGPATKGSIGTLEAACVCR